jgi:hypothetical protein
MDWWIGIGWERAGGGMLASFAAGACQDGVLATEACRMTVH